MFAADGLVVRTRLRYPYKLVADLLISFFVAGPAVVEKCTECEGEIRGRKHNEIEIAEEKESFGSHRAEAQPAKVSMSYARHGSDDHVRFAHVFVPCDVRAVRYRYCADDNTHICRSPRRALVIWVRVLIHEVHLM